jgi:hypothetical protein
LGCGSGRVILSVEQEIDDVFVQPDNWTLALTVVLEKDDAKLVTPTELLLNVLHVVTTNPMQSRRYWLLLLCEWSQ